MMFLGLTILSATPVPTASLQTLPQSTNKADLALWSRVWHGVTKQTKRHAVFARAQNDAAQKTLMALGVKAPVNQWVLTQLDDAALNTALASPTAVQLRAAPAHRPLSALSLRMIDAVPASSTDASAVRPATLGTGKGVLVGFVDTGIDLTHPAFKNADGSSRVVAAWDQDAETTAQAPTDFGYGQACDSATIRANKCAIGDPVGHGTHVAGIAVGGSDVQGVAPQADIAVVSSVDFTRLADAVSYLMHLADARNQPLVINISVGGQYGPHDGRTPLEDFLNAAARPGRILVAAAGNDGDDSIHLSATLSSTPQRVEIDGMPIDEDIQTTMEIWGNEGVAVDAALELWVGGVVQASVDLGTSPSNVVHSQLMFGGQMMADVSFAGAAPDDHGMVQNTLLIDRSQAMYLPLGGTLVVRLQGQGSIQAWLSQTDYSSGYSRFGSSVVGAGWLYGDSNRSISVPATAMEVIAVGSYTIQTTWESQTDGAQSLGDATVGGRSSFSSMGPAGYPEHTGFKPDLVAPGSVIVSARADSVPLSPDTVSPQLMVMQGTSMASPHVAGVVALMLEADPTLDTSQVRALLRQSAQNDVFTGAVPNFAWGFGKVDALKAVQAAHLGAGGCAQAQPLPWLMMMVCAMALRRRRARSR